LELGIDGKIIITKNCEKYYFNRGKGHNGWCVGLDQGDVQSVV
jgi:hypothetical protein